MVLYGLQFREEDMALGVRLGVVGKWVTFNVVEPDGTSDRLDSREGRSDQDRDVHLPGYKGWCGSPSPATTLAQVSLGTH